MSNYRGILIKDLISVIVIVGIIFVISIIGFVVIKKMNLEKYLYLLISIFLIATIIIGGYHIVAVSLDLNQNSFEYYTGKCSFPARDTLILDECDNKKLYAAVSVPNTTDKITIVYSKRSKIVVGFSLKT